VRIDAAVHVWSADAAAYPWSPPDGAPVPQQSATVEELDAELATVGFDGAVCIQPLAYGYDHRFLAGVLEADGSRLDGGRLAGVCLVDPTASGGPDDLAHLVRDVGCAGVRLLPYRQPTAAWLSGRDGDPLWEEIDRLGVPVSVLARPDQLGDVVERARRHPRTPIVIDHLAMVVPSENPSTVGRLLACAELDNVHVKLSAFGFLSRAPWPYDDLHPMLRHVLAAFGPDRVLFGTDWPNTRAYGDYRLSVDMFDRAVDLDDTGRALVLGDNAGRLWGIGHA